MGKPKPSPRDDTLSTDSTATTTAVSGRVTSASERKKKAIVKSTGLDEKKYVDHAKVVATVDHDDTKDKDKDKDKDKTKAKRGGLGALIPSADFLDISLLCTLTILAFVTRLYNIFLPNEVVFDEYHFARFLSEYARHEWFFDIHPPLAKLTMYAAAKMFGGFVAPDSMDFLDKIGNGFPESFNYQTPRVVAALFGVACIPIMYATVRFQFRLSQDVALMAASFVLFDTNMAIESRFVLTDSQLIFYCALTLYCMMVLYRTEDGTRERYIMIVVCGLFCGACISVKFTGLATPAITGLLCITGGVFLKRRLPIWQIFVIAFCGISLKLVLWRVHFWLLPKSGSGDLFVSPHFNLIGDKRLSKLKRPIEEFSFLKKVYLLNKEMIAASARIETRHPWESKWYEWPLTLRGILYWDGHQPHTKAKIYLLGNPMIYWFTAFIVFVFMVACGSLIARAVLHRIREGRHRGKPPAKVVAKSSPDAVCTLPNTGHQAHNACCYKSFFSVHHALHPGTVRFFQQGCFCLAGWCLNLLPYVGIKRCAFLYHYLPGLWYGIILTAIMLQFALPAKARVTVSMLLVFVSAGAYVYFSPWVYGFHVTNKQMKAMEWLPRWT